MCRRSLEALCKSFTASGKSLQAKLDALHAMEVIDKRLTQWAHGVRAIGSEAAHDTDTELSKDDARDALDFTEALLMYVFVLNMRFAAFSARRGQASAHPTELTTGTRPVWVSEALCWERARSVSGIRNARSSTITDSRCSGEKCAPLRGPRVGKRFREHYGRCCGKRGAASFEGPPNRFGELNRLMWKRLHDEVKVVKVLQAAIGNTAGDDERLVTDRHT